MTFKEGGTTLCTAPVGLVAGPTTTGSAWCAAPLSAGSHTITAEVGGYYAGTSSAFVTVAKPAGSSITGSGSIRPLRSAGTYPARLGSQVDVTSTATYGTSLSGKATVRFQSGSRTYEIRSTALESLGSSSTGGVGRADLRSKATLNDVTGPVSTPVASGLTLQVTVTDRGSPGSADSFAITLWNGSTLVFSSEWTGAKSQEIRLTGGNLVVR